MLNKNILLNNIRTLQKVNTKLVDLLVENIDYIEKNLELILKEEDFDINLNGLHIPNIKKKASKKIEDLDKALGVVWTYTMKINFPDELIKLSDNLDPSKDKLIYNTEALIIFGTLPFFHIEELIKNKEKYFPNLKKVIIYEPRLEFIYLFLLSVDIEKLAREGKIDLTFSYNEQTLLQHILLYFTIFSFVSYLKSYEDAQIKKLEDQMIKLYEKKMVTIPYESALFRIKNTKGIIRLQNVRYLLDFKPKKVFKETPVIIVGSGPSLDKDLEILKKIQDKAIVVSLTTAIRTLVNNGILPDFISIADAHRGMVGFLEGISEDILKKIYSFSAIFTEPEFTKKFKEGLIFNYGQIKNLLNIRDKIKVEQESGVTVLNTTFSLLTKLGFSKFLLLGVDLGTRIKEKIHTSGYQNKFLERKKEDIPNIEIEGNYGGKIFTRNDYYVSKLVFEEQIEEAKKHLKNLKIYNFSDGAKINGTITGDKSNINSILKSKVNKKLLKKNIRSLFKKEDVYFLDEEKNKIKKEIIPYLNSVIENIESSKTDIEVIKTLENFQLWGIYRGYLSDILFNNESFAKVQTYLKILKLTEGKEREIVLNDYKWFVVDLINQIKFIAEEIVS